MKRIYSLALLACLMMATFSMALAKEKKDVEDTTISEGAPVIVVCDDLKEKIATIAPVQEKVSQEFSKVTDQMLCGAMSQQCEYFLKVAKYYEREYRNQCEKGFELIGLSACNYEVNGCPKFEEVGSALKSRSKYRAGV